MPAESSAEAARKIEPGIGATRRHELGTWRRLRMLAWNTFPLLHAVGVVALALAPSWSPGWRALASSLVLFVLPPMLARLVTARRPLESGEHAMGSPTFFAWWALSCLQGLFNRMGFLEELLRLVPGLYSLWLRLWGARIGRLTFWAPRSQVLDRSLIVVGDEVVIGAGTQLTSHLLVRRKSEIALVLGEIRIGNNAVIGGLSRIAPGVEVEADEATLPCTILLPFNRFKDGRRVRASREVIDA